MATSLLLELWGLVARRIRSIFDFALFRKICKPWRSIATINDYDPERNPVPCLLFTEREREMSPAVKVWNLERNTIDETNLLTGTSFLSLNSYGWVLDIKNEEVSFAHFLSLKCKPVIVPDFRTLPRDVRRIPEIKKVVMFGSPTRCKDLIVIVLYGMFGKIAFCRPGDEGWTLIQCNTPLIDIVYFEGHLYALDSTFRIIRGNLRGPKPKELVHFFSFPERRNRRRAKGISGNLIRGFLAVSHGSIWVIKQYTRTIKIFAIGQDESFYEIPKFEEGHTCIFLGQSAFCGNVNWLKKEIIHAPEFNRYLDSHLYKLYKGRVLAIRGKAAWIQPSF